MPRLFVEVDPEDPNRARVGKEGISHVRALRLDVGSELEAIVAPGRVRRATIAKITRRAAELALGEDTATGAVDPERPLFLLLALADLARFDAVIEKATELGATHVLPFRAQRSQVSRVTKARQARWERIARGACEQCGRTLPPDLGGEASLEDRIAGLPDGTSVIALAPEAEAPWRAATTPAGPLALVVGPEGGLAPGELAWLGSRGAELRHLGPRILRFETAALAALAIAGSGTGSDHLE